MEQLSSATATSARSFWAGDAAFNGCQAIQVARTVQVLLPAIVRRALLAWFDAILFVLQVPLTDDGARQGGLLVFACDDGRLVHAALPSAAWAIS